MKKLLIISCLLIFISISIVLLLPVKLVVMSYGAVSGEISEVMDPYVSLIVKSFLIESGDKVNKGDTIAILDVDYLQDQKYYYSSLAIQSDYTNRKMVYEINALVSKLKQTVIKNKMMEKTSSPELAKQNKDMILSLKSQIKSYQSLIDAGKEQLKTYTELASKNLYPRVKLLDTKGYVESLIHKQESLYNQINGLESEDKKTIIKSKIWETGYDDINNQITDLLDLQKKITDLTTESGKYYLGNLQKTIDRYDKYINYPYLVAIDTGIIKIQEGYIYSPQANNSNFGHSMKSSAASMITNINQLTKVIPIPIKYHLFYGKTFPIASIYTGKGEIRTSAGYLVYDVVSIGDNVNVIIGNNTNISGKIVWKSEMVKDGVFGLRILPSKPVSPVGSPVTVEHVFKESNLGGLMYYMTISPNLPENYELRFGW